MHSPYVVGRWVRGSEHYDRQRLIDYLLRAQDNAIWVVGTRRMGKTSLLRQIELVTDRPDCRFVPLFWDLQGCATAADLSRELGEALHDAAPRFRRLNIDPSSLIGEDAIFVLRRLNRALAAQEKELLLLVDEAEVLIEIGQHEPAWLARLRKTLQEGRQRTIIVSTKLLTQLTHESTDWMTSPFLFGFHLVNLWPLRREGAVALIRQVQSAEPVLVQDDVLEDILRITNRHPYLIQYLCQRLYVPSETGGYLRAVRESDLAIDALLAGFFQVDFTRLGELEQRILLAVAEAGTLTQDAILEISPPNQHARIIAQLASLKELGYLRPTGGNAEGNNAKGNNAKGIKDGEGDWAIGSEFLRRWLLETAAQHLSRLDASDQPPRLDEENINDVADALGVSTERVKLQNHVQITTEAEFFDAIRSCFFEIRHLVEQDDGYKLLVTTLPDGTLGLRSEDEVQIAMKHWLRPMCRALNIHMDREPLTGRGFLDFKFSLGYDFRCLVEVKLFSNSRLQEGIGIQLPLYLLADKATYGLYIPILLNNPDNDAMLKELRRLASESARTYNVKMEVIDIRAWKPPVASKAGGLDDPDRYIPRIWIRSAETDDRIAPDQD